MPAACATMRRARSISLLFFGCTFTIRLPYTYPSRMNTAVLIMFRTSLVAVPAFMRVEPATISGPVSGVMAICTARANSESGVQLMPAVTAPRRRASAIAPSTYGVRPLAAIPTSTSREVKPRSRRSCAPMAGSSSVVSVARASACAPPAMMPCTNSASALKVGGAFGGQPQPPAPRGPRPRRKKTPPAGHEALHQFGVGAESRRAFGGIQHTQPPAGARANVEQTSAALDGRDDGVHRAGNGQNLARDRVRHLAVLGVDDLEDARGGQRVDAIGGGVDLFGQQILKHLLKQGRPSASRRVMFRDPAVRPVRASCP